MDNLKKTHNQHGYYYVLLTPKDAIAMLGLNSTYYICIIGHPYIHPSPQILAPNLTIQFIDFTYCNNKFAT